ncbi:response regulator [Streptomyces sp. 3MP-14]|uniref:Response regulator n=1 Tax=Streptomyces mimosae TaxID=2586635 RepID=A0A5N6A8U7_9ACTN|nr:MULTISPECIES: response regulator transcription factor [Streptomyces]KAB8164695.1 response regulator [Streptomyces mimosae]KAB8175611.1 response regulator [Streptomyces sp. 3MP-14]
MRILLLEDDEDLADLVALGLRNASYAVDRAATRAKAEELLAVTAYDVACLDLGLPDGDGLDLLRSLGGNGGDGGSRDGGSRDGGSRDSSGPQLRRPARVLLLTARDAVADRVAGLDAGADDYLVKPFHFAELLARLRALARRSDERGAVLGVGDLTLDQATHEVRRAGREVRLTTREFALLRYFLHRPGEVLSAEELLEHVWDANADPFTGSVRVILSRLRRKLGEPPLIHTVTGAGYRLREAP